MLLKRCRGPGQQAVDILQWRPPLSSARSRLKAQVIAQVESGGRDEAHVGAGRKEPQSCRISFHPEITSLLTAEFISVIAEFFKTITAVLAAPSAGTQQGRLAMVSAGAAVHTSALGEEAPRKTWSVPRDGRPCTPHAGPSVAICFTDK